MNFYEIAQLVISILMVTLFLIYIIQIYPRLSECKKILSVSCGNTSVPVLNYTNFFNVSK